jgi:hypothetical protein
METDPSAYARERVFPQESPKRLLVFSFTGKIKKFGNGISCRTGLLAGSGHE